MKTRDSYLRSFLLVLLVSILRATAMACPPPDCPACYSGSSCTVWDCGATGNCCNDSCCYSDCCNNMTVCCPSGQNCCNNSCCENACCVGGCCTSSTDRCCGTGCCDNSNECCGGTCCSPGYTCCCGSDNQNCCEGECCGGTQCCGAIPGGHCCEDTICYNESLGQTCCGYGDGTVCYNNRECCNGGCCPEGQYCCDDDCTDDCWTKTWVASVNEDCACDGGCPGNDVTIAGYYVCDASGPGEGGGRCGCVDEYTIVGVSYPCDINWNVTRILECAASVGLVIAECTPSSPAYNPAGCANTLIMGKYLCVGDVCDTFIEGCEEDDDNPSVERKTVFKYFEGESCGD